MTNVIQLRREKAQMADDEQPDIIDTSQPVMAQLEGSLNILKDRNLQSMIAERAVREGIHPTIQFLRLEIKELIQLARSEEALCHE